MAAMIAARRSSRLLAKLLAPARCAAAARPLNISATMRDAWDEDDRSFVAERRGDHRHRDEDSLNAFFSDVVGPMYRRRSLSQVLNLMDQLMETRTPMGAASRGMGYRRGWDAREDGDALYLRMDMPGLGKEQVMVSLEQNTLVIRGEGDGESGRGYRGRIDLPPEVYRVDQIRAEMRNGVLKVVVPMAKEEDEPRDAVHIQIH